VAARAAVDQLHGEPYAIADLAGAAFHDIAHAQLSADVLHLYGLASIGEGRVASDHEQLRDLRKVRDDVIGNAVAEILLLGISTQIVERQNCDRRLVRQRKRRRHGRSGNVRPDLEEADRRGNVLQPPFADFLEADSDFAAHLVAHLGGNTYAARLCVLLQACCQVDAISIEVLSLDDDIAEIDADAHGRASVERCFGSRFRQSLLERHRALDGIDRAGELDQHAVAHDLEDAAAVTCDERLQCLALRPDGGNCARLVLLHQPGVTNHVGGQDGSQSTLNALPGHCRRDVSDENDKV